MVHIPLNSGFELIPGYLDLVHARNPGAAFGFMAWLESDFRSAFFLLISLAALVIVSWIVIASKDMELSLLLGCSFFFAGALGNLCDRLLFGEVIDFLDFHAAGYHWPAFNVADSALCIGTALFFLQVFLGRRHEKNTCSKCEK
jgi:signal peptidase II